MAATTTNPSNLKHMATPITAWNTEQPRTASDRRKLGAAGNAVRGVHVQWGRNAASPSRPDDNSDPFGIPLGAMTPYDPRRPPRMKTPETSSCEKFPPDRATETSDGK